MALRLLWILRFPYFLLHCISFLILQTRMRPSSGARCLSFGRTLRLLPYVMWANSEGSGETARMCRLPWAIAGRLYVISTIIPWAGSYLVWVPSLQRVSFSNLIKQFKRFCGHLKIIKLYKMSNEYIHTHAMIFTIVCYTCIWPLCKTTDNVNFDNSSKIRQFNTCVKMPIQY